MLAQLPEKSSECGNIGAGTGATTGKAGGMKHAGKGGFGTACVQLGNGIMVAACFAVNAVGDVYDHMTGKKLAGMMGMESMDVFLASAAQDMSGKNTTIGVVGTNAVLSKEQANKLAQAGQDAVAMCTTADTTQCTTATLYLRLERVRNSAV